MATPRPEADNGPVPTADTEPDPDDPRLATLARLATHNAAEVARLAHENAELRLHIGRAGDLVELRGELAESTARLDAVTTELDRLRAIPELKVGQRLRQLGGSVVRSGGEAASKAPAIGTPEVDVPDDARGAGVPAGPAVDDGSKRGDDDGSKPVDDDVPSTGMGYTDPVPPSAVVVVRNRLGDIEPLLAWLANRGVTDVEFVDNASSDPATVEFLAASGLPVHRVGTDLGVVAPWALGVIARLLAPGDVLVADADTVPAEGCPADVLARMSHELSRHPDADAVEIAAADDGDTTSRRPLFQLVRAGSESIETTVELPAPYAVRCASWDLDDTDPAERYARLCDVTQT